MLNTTQEIQRESITLEVLITEIRSFGDNHPTKDSNNYFIHIP